MKMHGLSRLIGISAAGVGDSRAKVDAMTRGLFQISNLKLTLHDSELMEEVFDDSGLDSLAVRPARLVDGDATDRARIVDRCNGLSKIARADVARWMLNALERPEQFGAKQK